MEKKPIKGYEGYYSIMPDGTVISEARTVDMMRRGVIKKVRLEERILRTRTNSGGIPNVELSKDGHGKTVDVHRLVALTFLPPPASVDQTQARHKDGDRTNPHVNNLEWASLIEIQRDRIKNGTAPQGEQSGQSVLSNEKVLEIRRKASEGVDLNQLALEYNVGYSTITGIVSGRSWKHLPGTVTVVTDIDKPTEDDLAEMRPVKGYEGLYAVTKAGKVISVARTIIRAYENDTINMVIKERVLKQGLSSQAYPVVTLCKDGEMKTKAVHILVADAFLPPPTEGQTQVRHNDGNSLNPHVDNLKRGTPSENSKDRERHGTVNNGVRNGQAKRTEQMILEMRSRVSRGASRESVRKDYVMPVSSFNEVIRRGTWKHLP